MYQALCVFSLGRRVVALWIGAANADDDTAFSLTRPEASTLLGALASLVVFLLSPLLRGSKVRLTFLPCRTKRLPT